MKTGRRQDEVGEQKIDRPLVFRTDPQCIRTAIGLKHRKSGSFKQGFAQLENRGLVIDDKNRRRSSWLWDVLVSWHRRLSVTS